MVYFLIIAIFSAPLVYTVWYYGTLKTKRIETCRKQNEFFSDMRNVINHGHICYECNGISEFYDPSVEGLHKSRNNSECCELNKALFVSRR